MSQVQLQGLHGERGVVDAEHVRAAIRPGDDPFQPKTAAIAVENTHNFAGGTIWPLEAFRAVADVAREARLPLICRRRASLQRGGRVPATARRTTRGTATS